jgi:hypothetical protein
VRFPKRDLGADSQPTPQKEELPNTDRFIEELTKALKDEEELPNTSRFIEELRKALKNYEAEKGKSGQPAPARPARDSQAPARNNGPAHD